MVKSVDVEIMGELDSKKESQNNTKTKDKKTAKGCNFGQLIQRLHIARMQLVELARRNDFESKVDIIIPPRYCFKIFRLEM